MKTIIKLILKIHIRLKNYKLESTKKLKKKFRTIKFFII